MFVRIDQDLSVNINKIFSYKLSEDLDSYKLQVWGYNNTPIHTVIYPKSRPDLVKLLIDFNNSMRDLTVNNEVIENYIEQSLVDTDGVTPKEPTKHIEEEFVVED